jgi:hypothetical protein
VKFPGKRVFPLHPFVDSGTFDPPLDGTTRLRTSFRVSGNIA